MTRLFNNLCKLSIASISWYAENLGENEFYRHLGDFFFLLYLVIFVIL